MGAIPHRLRLMLMISMKATTMPARKTPPPVKSKFPKLMSTILHPP